MMQFNEAKNGWFIALHSGHVQLIQIDFRLSLLVSDGPDEAWIHIETPGMMKSETADAIIDPGKTNTLSPILALFNAEVMEITISRTGLLKMQFAANIFLDVAPDHTYEAWQIEGKIGDNSFMLVCPPDGKVTLFRASR